MLLSCESDAEPMALVWSQANYASPHTLPSIQTEVNTAERTLVLVCAIHWMSFTCVLCMYAKEWRTIV